jgi:hypothetical protein
MGEEEQRAVDTVELLRALVDQVMDERDLEDEEDAVGVPVVPATAGMDLSTPRYNAAIEELLDVGALERDDETDELLGNISGEPEAFKITREGLELLRETGM